MNENIINNPLNELEHDERVVILKDFLKDKQIDEIASTEMLLDVIHKAFTIGFKLAIQSVISSTSEKKIE